MAVFGIVSLFAMWRNPQLSSFSPLLPLAMVVLYRLHKDGDPTTTVGKHARILAYTFGAFIAFASAVFAVTFLAYSLDADYLARIFMLLPPAIIGLLLVGGLAGWIIRWQHKARGQADALFGLAFFQPLHAWQPIDDETAHRAWQKMHRYPPGGRLERGWLSKRGQVMLLECTKADGSPCLLLQGEANAMKRPWVHWLAGIYLKASRVHPGGPLRLSAGVFDHPQCRWRPLPQSELTAALEDGIGDEAASPVIGWWCRDCRAIRLDFVDAEGHDFCFANGALQGEAATWYAGIFFVFGQSPTLATDVELGATPQPIG